MGRIKSALVKRTAKKLVNENDGLFSGDFEKNKKILQNVVVNKRARNIITGYVTRLIRRK